MSREKKLSKYILTSTLLHMLIALAISGIYAQQPQQPMGLKIVSAVRIEYKEPEPPPKPKPKVVIKSEPQEKAKPKKVEPKVEPQKVEPPKVTQRARRMKAPAPGLALERAPERSRAAPGAAGIKGRRGAPGDRPGMRASGGINHPDLTTTVGGVGLSPDTHGSMMVPAGTGQLPGAGGKDAAGFKMGLSRTGTGVGRVDIPGSGGSGGTRGKDEEGPGAGSANTGPLDARGGGTAATGLGVGSTGGMGEVDSEPGGRGPGGGGGGPGSGGYDVAEARSGPNLISGTGTRAEDDKELPERKNLPEEKRSGAIGKKGFKADVRRDMTGVAQDIDEPVSQGYEDALQAEINKHLYSLRKMYEDWQNHKLSNIPKVLQITVELNAEKGKPKLLKVDFHNSALPPRIVNDLTTKIKSWKFESLYDGKDDPKKWPIKLSGKISWQ